MHRTAKGTFIVVCGCLMLTLVCVRPVTGRNETRDRMKHILLTVRNAAFCTEIKSFGVTMRCELVPRQVCCTVCNACSPNSRGYFS